MYIIGFCEALIDMLKQYVQDYTNITGSMINDVRMIGCITLVLILGLAIVGMDWVTRVSSILFIKWDYVSALDYPIPHKLTKTKEGDDPTLKMYNVFIFAGTNWSFGPVGRFPIRFHYWFVRSWWKWKTQRSCWLQW